MFANCRGPAAKPATSVVPDVPYVTVSLSVPDSSRASSLPRPPGRSTPGSSLIMRDTQVRS
ncbi:hypothetical protein DA456_21100 [Pseudomonas syringae pv. atrofaciens]|uniref:Uncharacterized protein n=1 Tax=Pseudomonas syringae pv. atrofaciens TaxID=192087 RepID=A0AAD0IEB4_PSESX|nr:hypothetical protein DA456_21100 [Pseudomonas syringae pv. atrofaciens]